MLTTKPLASSGYALLAWCEAVIAHAICEDHPSWGCFAEMVGGNVDTLGTSWHMPMIVMIIWGCIDVFVFQNLSNIGSLRLGFKMFQESGKWHCRIAPAEALSQSPYTHKRLYSK